ncbi:MAG: hypothetical protein ACI9TH_004158 [Kiritimatiellia bacterium]|jgi:hypothetical protein
MKNALAITACIVSLASSSSGNLITLENFEDYPTAAPLAGLSGGTGWTGAWTTGGSGAYTIIDGGLSYAAGDISIQGGAKALSLAFPDDAIDVVGNRPLPAQNNTLYMSLLYRHAIDDEGDPNSGNDFFQMGFLPTNGNPNMSVMDRNTTFQVRTGTATQTDTSISSEVGTTYFLVLKLENTGGGAAYDRSTLFVNPTSLTEGSNPSFSSGTADVLDLSSSAFFNIRRAFQEAGDTYHIDALRIGTSFDDVVNAIPEPDTSVLAILGILLIGRRLRR